MCGSKFVYTSNDGWDDASSGNNQFNHEEPLRWFKHIDFEKKYQPHDGISITISQQRQKITSGFFSFTLLLQIVFIEYKNLKSLNFFRLFVIDKVRYNSCGSSYYLWSTQKHFMYVRNIPWHCPTKQIKPSIPLK